MNAVYLNQFKIVMPRNRLDQDDLLAWITHCHQQAELVRGGAAQEADRVPPETIAKLFDRYAVKSSQISQRYMECDDINSNSLSDAKIYPVTTSKPSGADISARAEYFSHRAFEVFKVMYQPATKRPDHLIHVTCTGYVSPSAAQRIVVQDDWEKETDVTHAYHMGCYAAMPAVRMARALVNSSDAALQTDIVHTEMCGLHMNPVFQTPEQMVVQTLFADGHIKYSATQTPSMSGNATNLKILAIQEKVVAGSEHDMSWTPAPWGMQMNLSREVPSKIKENLKAFSESLFAKAGLSFPESQRSVFAIHPGGPKIIDAVKEVLELREDQINESRKILFERGNMSSATLPHVWNEILEGAHPTGTKVVSYAFGPGLTLFGSVFEVC